MSLFSTILRRITNIGGTMINPILHNTTVSKPTLIKDSHRSSQSKGKTCIDKVHREDQVNRDDLIIQVHILTNIMSLFLTILRRITDIGGTMINPILHNTTVSKPTLIKDSRHSSHQLNHKNTCKLHARPRRHPIRSSVLSHN